MPSKRHRYHAKNETHIPPKRAGKNVGSIPGEKTPLGLRIIGGQLRGSKLQYSGDNRVRPMKDRTREAVFNLISVASKGKHVIDLFSGTGALAIEAISRGAVSATLVEKHLGTMKNLRQNIESLRLTDCCRLVQADAFYLAKYPDEFHVAANLSWLIFCSPPYDFFVTKQSEMIELLQLMYQNAPDHSVFVVESDSRFHFERL
jgi:16S rRNA (guanine(966)-N(2))-methyltransferase RsmD